MFIIIIIGMMRMMMMSDGVASSLALSSTCFL